MLGHRGCRLGIIFPEITEMQARAIFEAACRVRKEKASPSTPEIMIPLVGHVKELDDQEKIVRDVAEEVIKERGIKVHVPRRHDDRAAARGGDGRRDRDGGRVLQLRHERPDADDLRPLAATTRARFLPEYVEREIFLTIRSRSWTRAASGKLMAWASTKGRPTQPESEDRHLRRARRRALERGVLPPDEARLRLLLSLPGPDRPPRRGAGGAEGESRGEGREKEDGEAQESGEGKERAEAVRGRPTRDGRVGPVSS